MEEGAKLFARGGVDKEAKRLKAENRRLTQAVGELAMELKKRLVSRRARSFEADKAILPKIEELQREHPAWGCRRVWAWLRRCEGLKINHKRVMRVMKANSLDVRPARRLKAPREAETHKMRGREPKSLWGTDMTKVMIPSEGWAYLHVVLDWASKKLVGWSLSRTSKASNWLAALDSAVAAQFPHGIKD